MIVTGKQIRAARAALGMKLQELAREAGVSPTTVSSIENGRNAYQDTLKKLGAVLEGHGARFQVDDNGIVWVGVPNDKKTP